MKQYAFSDSVFMSAREKALVLKAWVRFLKNGLRREDFSGKLYKHLINHCGLSPTTAGRDTTPRTSRTAKTPRGFFRSSTSVASAARSSTGDLGLMENMRICEEPWSKKPPRIYPLLWTKPRANPRTPISQKLGDSQQNTASRSSKAEAAGHTSGMCRES